jgi:hypothetical protein
MEGVRAAIGRYTVDLIASHSLVDSCQLREPGRWYCSYENAFCIITHVGSDPIVIAAQFTSLVLRVVLVDVSLLPFSDDYCSHHCSPCLH